MNTPPSYVKEGGDTTRKRDERQEYKEVLYIFHCALRDFLNDNFQLHGRVLSCIIFGNLSFTRVTNRLHFLFNESCVTYSVKTKFIAILFKRSSKFEGIPLLTI